MLLWIGAAYQVFDGFNLGASFALRGAGDVRVPTLLVLAVSWLGFVPLTHMLSFAPGQGWVHFLPQFGLGTVGGWSALLFYTAALGVTRGCAGSRVSMQDRAAPVDSSSLRHASRDEPTACIHPLPSWERVRERRGDWRRFTLSRPSPIKGEGPPHPTALGTERVTAAATHRPMNRSACYRIPLPVERGDWRLLPSP
jgi:hypothetical protein